MLRNLRPRRSNELVSQRAPESAAPEKENVVMNPATSLPRPLSADQEQKKLRTEASDVEMHSKSAGPSASSPTVHSGKRKRNFSEDPEPTGRNTHVRRATLPVSRASVPTDADIDDLQSDSVANLSAGGAALEREVKVADTPSGSPDDFACTEELPEDACEEKEYPDSAATAPTAVSADVAMVAAAAATGWAAAVRQVLVSPPSKRRNDSPIPPTMSCLRVVLDSNVDDMLNVMYEREVLYQPSPEYMSEQPEIDHLMRAILIDWMMEVGQEFSLCRETLQLAANYVDRYLSVCPNISRVHLQLLGVTSLFVASKLEEMMPGKAFDFAVTTDNAYNAEQILEMERSLLQTLNWKLLAQTPYSWVRMYIKLLLHELQKLQEAGEYKAAVFQGYGYDAMCDALLSTQSFFRCMDLLDVILLDVTSLRFHSSTKAAAALCITFPQIVPLMPGFAHYGIENLQECIDYISNFCVLPPRLLQFPPSAYFNMEVRADELFTKQMHHPDALDLYKELQSS